MSPTKSLLALSAVVLAAATYAGVHSVGPVPPLGGLLDPVNGVWGNAGTAVLPRRATAAIPGLGAGVQVRYDQRGVPHIFASTEEDAFRALGYVVARDRLFQLEIQTRAASGRLTELVGPVALSADQSQRRLGLTHAAEVKFAALDPNGTSRRIMDAYAEGVNAYIEALTPAAYPIEYKLLHARPERWHAINSVYLLNRMGWTLASGGADHLLARAAALVGDSAAASVFPVHSPIQEPIQPVKGWTGPHEEFSPIVPPGQPDSDAVQLSALLREMDGSGPSLRTFASNNWAVSPQRTSDGFALLEGDPHLQLTLPSIWYEVQLTVPGKLDVYGVTIPGAPGVVIGFNRDVAWTFTNTSADVMDFYRETVNDTLNPTRYMVDGKWHPISTRIEQYRDQSGNVIGTDTVRYTERGPLSHSGNNWISMRWTVLEPSNEMQALYDAAHARNAYDFQASMAKNFWAPAQNMLVADRSGTIAIRSTGHFPIRPAGTTGRFLFDGSTSSSDWVGFWPVNELPQSVNPAQGFLASANQEPEAPAAQFGYIGSDPDFEVWRALRINELLRSDSSVTVDDITRWQTDPSSTRAKLFLPYLINAASSLDSMGRGTAELDSAAHLLRQWDGRYTLDNECSVLFEAAMHELAARTWDELLRDGQRVATPTSAVLVELMTQPSNPWWDDRRTANVVESRDDIIAASLVAAYRDVTTEYGPSDAGGWRWDRIRFANIYHLLRIPAFSALRIPVPGGVGTLTPSSGDGEYGPSWRMVVQMGPSVQAWGTLPGGQSGNPLSPRYRDHLTTWARGTLAPLLFPKAAANLSSAETTASLSLEPAR